jgi:hypothetical protein
VLFVSTIYAGPRETFSAVAICNEVALPDAVEFLAGSDSATLSLSRDFVKADHERDPRVDA